MLFCFLIFLSFLFIYSSHLSPFLCCSGWQEVGIDQGDIPDLSQVSVHLTCHSLSNIFHLLFLFEQYVSASMYLSSHLIQDLSLQIHLFDWLFFFLSCFPSPSSKCSLWCEHHAEVCTVSLADTLPVFNTWILKAFKDFE